LFKLLAGFSVSPLPRVAEDIVAAPYCLQANTNAHPLHVGVVGLSMGGAATIYAASHDSRIRSEVMVSAFADPADIMKLEYYKRHIPHYPMRFLVFEYFQYPMGKGWSILNTYLKINANEFTVVLD